MIGFVADFMTGLYLRYFRLVMCRPNSLKYDTLFEFNWSIFAKSAYFSEFIAKGIWILLIQFIIDT